MTITKDTETHIRPRQLLDCWTATEYDGAYPAYINITQVGTMVQITIRGEAKENGDPGDTAMVELNICTFSTLMRNAAANWKMGAPSWVLRNAAPASAPAPVADDEVTTLRARVAELERNLLQEERDHNATMTERDALAAQVERLTKALHELVACKALKEARARLQERNYRDYRSPMTDAEVEQLDWLGSEYSRRQPRAWDEARAALAQSTPDAAGAGEG